MQVKVIPVRESHNEYAEKVHKTLLNAGIRSKFDGRDLNLGKKVRETKNEKIPYWIVIGDKDISAGKVTLESRDRGSLGQMTEGEVVKKLENEIVEKSTPTLL